MAEREIGLEAQATGSGGHAPEANLLLRLARISALRNSMLLVVLAAVWLFFYFATNGTFLTQRNLVLLALQTSIVSLAAISAVMLIVTRNFDLSVGSAVALVGVILALLTVKHDVNPLFAVTIALAVGVSDGRLAGSLGDARWRLVLHRHACGHALFPRHIDDRHQRRDGGALPRSLTGFATGFLPPMLSIVASGWCYAATVRYAGGDPPGPGTRASLRIRARTSCVPSCRP